MDSFVAWLQATPLSLALQRQAQWLWPLCETLHFVGLALVIGTAGFFDLWLLGMMARMRVSAIQQFLRWAIVGFSINLLTGLVFLISEPAQYAGNSAWWAKVGLLMVAGLNALFFQRVLSRKAARLQPGEPTPVAFKMVGALLGPIPVSEQVLTRHPSLKAESAPFNRGLLAFHVLNSTGYAVLAFTKAGPPGRDTLGMARTLRVSERWVGALVLAPAVLDAIRYFHPEARWAAWVSRGIEIGTVVLVIR